MAGDYVDKNEIEMFKDKIIDYKRNRYFKSFSAVMEGAKKHLKINYEEEGIFKKKYLICRSDFGKKIFLMKSIFVIFSST